MAVTLSGIIIVWVHHLTRKWRRKKINKIFKKLLKIMKVVINFESTESLCFPGVGKRGTERKVPVEPRGNSILLVPLAIRGAMTRVRKGCVEKPGL